MFKQVVMCLNSLLMGEVQGGFSADDFDLVESARYRRLELMSVGFWGKIVFLYF
jgi:hypothetical protein